jgi:hypothetical protein
MQVESGHPRCAAAVALLGSFDFRYRARTRRHALLWMYASYAPGVPRSTVALRTVLARRRFCGRSCLRMRRAAVLPITHPSFALSGRVRRCRSRPEMPS